MGCKNSLENSTIVQDCPPVAVAPVDAAGYGLMIAASAPSPTETQGERYSVTVSVNGGAGTAVQIRGAELVVRLKARLFEAQPDAIPPPCVTTLEFCDVAMQDDQTFQAQAVCPDALLKLSFEPSATNVEFYGLQMFRLRGQGPPRGAVWGVEPVQSMLTRLVKRLGYEKDNAKVAQMVKKPWHMHTDTGHFSKPVPVDTRGTVEQAGIADGATLMPGSHREYFENHQKEKYMTVGTEVRYYGDVVKVCEIVTSGGRNMYLIEHDNQVKRTIIEKLEFAHKQGD